MALFGDWRDIRKAVEDAVEIVDGVRPTGSIDKRDYAIVRAAIESFRASQAFACIECGEVVEYGLTKYENKTNSGGDSRRQRSLTHVSRTQS